MIMTKGRPISWIQHDASFSTFANPYKTCTRSFAYTNYFYIKYRYQNPQKQLTEFELYRVPKLIWWWESRLGGILNQWMLFRWKSENSRFCPCYIISHKGGIIPRAKHQHPSTKPLIVFLFFNNLISSLTIGRTKPQKLSLSKRQLYVYVWYT